MIRTSRLRYKKFSTNDDYFKFINKNKDKIEIHKLDINEYIKVIYFSK